MIAQLPFAGDAGGIAGSFELMGKGNLSTVKHAKFYIVSYIVLPGHDLCPGRRADWIGKAVCEAHTFCGKFVEVGLLAGFAPIGG